MLKRFRAHLSSFDYAALLLLGFAMVVGGSKSAALSPLIEAAAYIMLGALIWRGGIPRGSKIVLAVAGLIAALMMAQIMPLPFAVWSSLPGRETAAAVLASIGQDGWTAISLSPHATLAALPTVAVAAAFAAWAAQARPAALHAALGLFVALALVGGLLGLIQFGTGGPYLRNTAHKGLATGFFTNRNHLALTLALAIVAIVVLFRELERDYSHVKHYERSGRMAVLAVAVIVTLFLLVLPSFSRSGLVLGGMALTFGLIALGPRFMTGRRAKRRRLGIATGFGIVMAMLLFAAIRADVDSLGSLRRFELLDDEGRFAMWSGTWFAVRQVLPWGTGFGTFMPVYASFEDLEQVGPGMPNEAHNEYLQILLEGGAPFTIVAAAVIALYIYAAYTMVTRRDASGVAVSLALGLVLLHSIVDFPLRSYALLVPVSILAGLLLNFLHNRGPRRV